MTATPNKPGLAVRVVRLEEVARREVLDELEIEPLDIRPELFAWFEAAGAAMARHPDMAALDLQGEFPKGDQACVDLILCSREALDEISNQPGGLGVFLVDTHDADVFGDEAPYARAYRVAVAWDEAAFLAMLAEELPQEMDPDAALDDLITSWLATVTHELHHVRLFAENADLNSPQDADTLGEELGRDLFDCITGYGIRPLVVDDEEIDPEDAEDARNLMEDHVEERGRIMAAQVFHAALSPEIFLAAAGLTERVEEILAPLRLDALAL